MTETLAHSAFGELIEPASLRIERILPGPIERIWSYLTESDLRAQWLARGDMQLRPGAKVEFVWRNGELSGRAEERPEGVNEEGRMTCEIFRAEPPRLLVIGWGTSGSEVTFELEPQGAEVKFTVTHRRLPDRANLLGVSAGWHAHLEFLGARLHGREPPLFWKTWAELKAAYDQRLPA
ncbi:MAG: SRPBCC family protein [Alphaproteobacteria bacterium]|nr:SRPBCC family protein [Alphaproteobacteria bacterium]MBU1513446.1 SRPBCC family protein [Alphaproteobacteria bacterium]MBU2096438.1 SRPBCC family protein [Alphaproteobacteria bacterium]MBU2149870.1 SRPBCC family protein [Alphaproteobacteria bacterium]MBU2308224.1 SRPBCC family protein [Alphaproteobacteria bacterium]